MSKDWKIVKLGEIENIRQSENSYMFYDVSKLINRTTKEFGKKSPTRKRRFVSTIGTGFISDITMQILANL